MNLEELRREGHGETFWRAIEVSNSAHLSYEVLEAFTDGLLDVTGQAAVHAHAEGCPRCRAALDDFLAFAPSLSRSVPMTEALVAPPRRLLTPANLLIAAIFVLVLAVIPLAFPRRDGQAARPAVSTSSPPPVLPSNVHSLIPSFEETRPMVDFGVESLATPVMIFDASGAAVQVVSRLTGSRAPVEAELVRGQTYSWKSADGRAGRFRILTEEETRQWHEALDRKSADPLACAEAAIGFGLLSEAESRLKPLATSDPLARQMLKELVALRAGHLPAK